ncbi:TPA: DUF2169 domain-containing protein [Neisseria elongata]
MFELQNFTCFHTQQFKNIDQTDRAYDVVVAKVSYEFEIDPETGKTELAFARKQTPLTFADTYYGDPSQTSTQFESDFSLYKPKTDLVVNTTAYAPDDVPSRQFTVSVSIGDYQKSLALTGERYWVREAAGWSLSEPDPILSLPIRYEFAFGGSAVEDDHTGYQQNAIGIGYYPKYDPNSNLVRAANRHSITCFDYNGNGQLIAQHQWKVPSKEENARNGLPETDWRDAQYDMLYLPVTETIRYHYDFNGNRTATVLPDGRQINCLYYGSGHLHQISLDDEVITDIERDKLHREIFRTQGKLASRYELDPLGRLKRQIATLNDLAEGGKGKNKVAAGFSQTAVKRSYGYDRTGNLTHSTDQRTGTTRFEYDKLGRITQAGSERFAFDPAHNILSDGLNPVPDNRLKTYNGTTYYYDGLGNLIHRELADGEVQNYFYDLHDQLVKAEIFKKDGTKETWAYTYDALGRRIGKGRLKTDDSLEVEQKKGDKQFTLSPVPLNEIIHFMQDTWRYC